jgi:hypothetical protein
MSPTSAWPARRSACVAAVATRAGPVDDLQTHLTTGLERHRRIQQASVLYPTEGGRQDRLRRLREWSSEGAPVANDAYLVWAYRGELDCETTSSSGH